MAPAREAFACGKSDHRLGRLITEDPLHVRPDRGHAQSLLTPPPAAFPQSPAHGPSRGFDQVFRPERGHSLSLGKSAPICEICG